MDSLLTPPALIDRDHGEAQLLRAENAALRESLRELSDLISIAPAFCGFLSPDGVVTGCNELSLRAIEAARADVLGRPLWESPWWAGLPEAAARIREAVLLAAQLGSESRFDVEYAAPHGAAHERRWVALTISGLRAPDGEVTRIAATGVDITERRVAQEALRRSEEQLARAATVAKVGFYDWDIAADRVTYSDQMKRDWGLTGPGKLEEAVALIHPEDRERVWAEIVQAMAAHKDFATEYRIVREDQRTLWIEAHGHVQYDAEERPCRFFGTSLDVTERRLAQEKLLETKERLEVAVNTLELERDLRERFISMLSHDLRTPLTSARMSSELISRHSSETMVHTWAVRIRDSLVRADSMIRDLLDLNKVKAGDGLPITREPCDLPQLISDTLSELGTVHGDRFVLVAPPSLVGSFGKNEVRRLVENLCANAVKYGASQRPVTLTLSAIGEEVHLGVHNEGIPIPPDELERIFDPFRRSASAQAGTERGWGLGLALVRGIAEAHGGTVTVESSEAAGTLFTVRMPREARQGPE